MPLTNPPARTVLSRFRPLVAAGLLALPAVLGGCWVEGGRGNSADAFTYVSTEYQPKTISLVDTRTGQTVWSYELPVGRQLNMQFFRGDSNTAADFLNPDTMTWDDVPAKTYFGLARQRLAVPPATARRIDVALRPSPELTPEPVRFDRGPSARRPKVQAPPAEVDLTGR
jgi:hypothetical protein